jgi:hypothetical protein
MLAHKRHKVRIVTLSEAKDLLLWQNQVLQFRHWRLTKGG